MQGKLRLLAPIQPRYLANSVSTCFTIPHVRKVHHEPWKSGLSRISSKYRRFTFFNHRAGENPTSYPYPTALFGVILPKLTPATSRGKYGQVRHESAGVCSFLLFIQISPFYLFQSWCRGKSDYTSLSNDAIWRIAFQPVSQFLMYAKYTASPENRGFRASHPNIAVLPFSIIGSGQNP